jgi:hypothetical protein
MIHYVTVGVATSRPPGVHEYRRYALYGGTHAEAELVALQMAACTSTMPVEIVRADPTCKATLPGRDPRYDCLWEGCTVATTEPHGAMGCRCWRKPWADLLRDHSAEDEAWLIDEHCPLHGKPAPTEHDEPHFFPDDGTCACTRPCCGTGSEGCICPDESPDAGCVYRRKPPEAAASASGAPFAGTPDLTGPCGCPCDACSLYCEQLTTEYGDAACSSASRPTMRERIRNWIPWPPAGNL